MRNFYSKPKNTGKIIALSIVGIVVITAIVLVVLKGDELKNHIGSYFTTETMQIVEVPIMTTPQTTAAYTYDRDLYDSFRKLFIPKPVTSLVLPADNSELIDIQAKYALVIDLDEEKILYNKNADAECQPASIVKLLAALVTLQHLEMNEVLEVGEEINSILPGSSVAEIRVGQKLTVKMLLGGLLVHSGNDVSYVLAKYVSAKTTSQTLSVEESVKVFCDLMNEEAKRIGAVNSHFTTPDGYDDSEQYTNAFDISLIAMEALKHPEIAEICSRASIREVFITGEDVTWRTTNFLIDPRREEYYPNAKGLKTGSSVAAGSCLVSYAEANGKRIMATVMNSTTSKRWEDSVKLLDYFTQANND